MSVQDLISEEDEARAHEYTFCLWPKSWQEYSGNPGLTLNWQECQFVTGEVDNVPNDPGLYSFLIQPRLAGHPSCSYLMYVGKTKALRQRFRQYLREKERESGRPKVVRLLNKYPDNLFFCYTVLPDVSHIDEAEQALIGAFLPPCNDKLPAKVRVVMEALR